MNINDQNDIAFGMASSELQMSDGINKLIYQFNGLDVANRMVADDGFYIQRTTADAAALTECLGTDGVYHFSTHSS